MEQQDLNPGSNLRPEVYQPPGHRVTIQIQIHQMEVPEIQVFELNRVKKELLVSGEL